MALEQAPNWSILVGEPVQVDWDDAIWWTEETADPALLGDLCHKQTVGFLVRVTDRAVFLAHEREVDGSWWGITRVPRDMVLKLRCLSRATFDTDYSHTAT